MPLTTIDLTTAPGFVVQTCACCHCEHRVSLDRGGTDTKEEPFAIPVGSTLDVRIDGQATPQTVTFAAGDFPDFGAVTAAQLRDKLNAVLVGATAVLNLDGHAVTIESDATGAMSKVEVTGGSARAALGFPPTASRIRARAGPSSARTSAAASRRRTSSASAAARAGRRSSSFAPGTSATRSTPAPTTTSTAAR
jgi:hypothetical protein